MKLALALVVVIGGCSKSAEEYIQKSKRSEAELHLLRLSKSAKLAAVEIGRFPIVQTALVPATECCAQPKHICQPDPQQWAASPWIELEFTVDEPHRFRYSYQSDGKTFTARAVGDLDCDTTTITYTLTGTIEANGNVSTLLEKPTNSD
jgi:hypothetical protein